MYVFSMYLRREWLEGPAIEALNYFAVTAIGWEVNKSRPQG